jgi:hypothetical protein
MGGDTLAVAIAKAAMALTREKLSPTRVAEVLGIPKSTGAAMIDRIGIK